MYKIITVCGMGVGSSLILKMTVESAMSQLNHACQVEHWDMGTVKGQACDFIVTTSGFQKHFNDQENVVYVDNILDVAQVKERIAAYLATLS